MYFEELLLFFNKITNFKKFLYLDCLNVLKKLNSFSFYD